LRSVLVAALASCIEGPLKPKTRRFLGGLSRDELQFIAEFLGASILESDEMCAGSRLELAQRIVEFQRVRGALSSSADQDHKTILLLEFLCSSSLRHEVPVAVRAAHA
jgi:hypothetical protein